MINKYGGKTSRGSGAKSAQAGCGAGEASAGPSARGKGKAASANGQRNRGALAALGIEEPHEGPGRPIEYRPEFVRVAHGMAKLGGTDFEIAEELGISTSTLWRWRSKYPEFSSALLEGKEAFDNRAERSLAQKAIGYSYHSEKVFQYEGRIVRAEIVEHVPPDIGAIKMWLGNRRPDKWRDKSEVKLDGSDAFLKVWQAISDGTAG